MKKNKLIKILKNREKDDFYIIGETAYNHEGDLNYLYKMINDISELKLDAVKFHLLLNPGSYMQKKHPLMSETKKWIFSKNEWEKIIDYSTKKGLEVIALCDDIESIEFILKNKLEIVGIELHMSCLNDYFMIKKLDAFKGIIILGIGGSTIEEIEYALDLFRSQNQKNILLMYGFQAFPTKYKDVNLRKMLKIKEMFGVNIGYADHTLFNDEYNELISVMGYILGAKVLEKHYTPSYGIKRTDFQASVGRDQMLKIKNYLGIIRKVLGKGRLTMSKPEKEYGQTGPMKKAIVARKKIKKGHKLQLQDLWYKRTKEKTYLKQNQIWDLIECEAVKDIMEDEIVDFHKVKYISRQEKSAKQFTCLKK